MTETTADQRSTAGGRRVPLTPRELEVVSTYVLGATAAQTAARHFVAKTTVKTHVNRVAARYADAGRPTANSTQLLLEMMADGWIAPPTPRW